LAKNSSNSTIFFPPFFEGFDDLDGLHDDPLPPDDGDGDGLGLGEGDGDGDGDGDGEGLGLGLEPELGGDEEFGVEFGVALGVALGVLFGVELV